MPPLAADGHRRDPAWRDGLALLLDDFDGRATPAPARAVIANLRDAGCGGDRSAWPTSFSIGGVDAADAGAALYVAAALQVYFTRSGGGFAGGLLAAAPAARAVPLLRFDAGLRAS